MSRVGFILSTVLLLVTVAPAEAESFPATTSAVLAVVARLARCELLVAGRRVEDPRQRAFLRAASATFAVSIAGTSDPSKPGRSETVTMNFVVDRLLPRQVPSDCAAPARLQGADVQGSLGFAEWLQVAGITADDRRDPTNEVFGYQQRLSLETPDGAKGTWRLRNTIGAGIPDREHSNRIEIYVGVGRRR